MSLEINTCCDKKGWIGNIIIIREYFCDDQLSTDVNEVFCLPFNYAEYVFVENLGYD